MLLKGINLLLGAVLVVCVAGCQDDLCKMDHKNKCSMFDKECIAKLEGSLRKWYQTDEAKGYFVEPVEPMTMKIMKITFQGKKYALRNVVITGILNSNYMINNITNISSTVIELDDEYVYNLTLHADNSVVMDPKTKSLTQDDTPVHIVFENIHIRSITNLEKVKRCTGITYTDLKPLGYLGRGGTIILITGLASVAEIVGAGKMGISLAENVGEEVTKAIHERQKAVFHAVSFDTLFKTPS